MVSIFDLSFHFSVLAVQQNINRNIENEDEFTITANLCIRGRNFLNWKTPKIVQERTFKLHTKRRAEILRVLKGMVNVLHFGIPAANRVSSCFFLFLTIPTTSRYFRHCKINILTFPFVKLMYCTFWLFAQACQLKQMPASVENMGDIVPEEYLDQRARGCFEAKFLAHLYGSPAIGESSFTVIYPSYSFNY